MPRMRIVTWYYMAITYLLRILQWWLGASTVGVRTLVIDEANRVLLIKHTYMENWHFPGGGVLPGEPARVAAIRELFEETGVQAEGKIELLGVYFHKVYRVNDYVILYRVPNFKLTSAKISPEIAESKWFPLNALPDDLYKSTAQRIAEHCYHQPIIDQW